MKQIILGGILFALLSFDTPDVPNVLTEKEKKEGWKLLFDGRTGEGWQSIHTNTFPEKGWTISDGSLTIQQFDSSDVQRYGDIISMERYSDFDLMFDLKLAEGANSGLK